MPLAYRYRDIEEPSFSFRSGLLYAVFLLLLFGFFIQKTRLLEVQLSDEELREIEKRKEELQRDLTFRFVESPEDKVEPKPDVAFSDVTRKAKSITNEEIDPQNEDPFSKGDSYDLKQRNEPSPQEQEESPAKPLAMDQVPTMEPPQDPVEPTPVKPEMEPKDLPETQDEKEVAKMGAIPTWAGAPKPYRPPSKQELDEAKEAAKQAMAKDLRFRNQNMAREREQYDNLEGKAMPNIGFSVDTAGHDLGPYLKLFIQLVKSNWRIPNIARLEASGVSLVQFKLHKDGAITEAFVLSESGFEALDVSSLNAIVNTNPAPPLPDHITEEWIPIKFAFYYNIRPPRR